MENNPDKTLVTMDTESYALHTQSGLAAVPYSSQAGGLFNKMAAGSLGQMNAGINSMYPMVENEARFKHIQKLSDETGLSITQIGLGYLLSQPFTVIPIVGCHTLVQLKDSLSAAEVCLIPSQVEFLDRI
jgi:aryl-alcohol dehydrogenase-like predicted oxidoreductase